MDQYKKRGYLPILVLLVTLMGFSSCIDENLENCGSTVYVKFDYSYNMLSKNLFGKQVDMAVLYMFDASGVLVKEIKTTEKFGDDYTLIIPHVMKGKYTLAAWGESTRLENSESDFIIPAMTVGGSTVSDLNYYIQRGTSNEQRCEQDNFLAGLAELSVAGQLSTENVTIPFSKVTNKVRVVLISEDATVTPDAGDFDLRIADNIGNGHINYNYELLADDKLNYLPYYTGNEKVDPLTGYAPESGTGVDAVVAEMSLSRLMADKNSSKLSVFNKNGSSVAEIDLPEHYQEYLNQLLGNTMGLQEYFDREDEYAIIIRAGKSDTDGWIWLSIRINDWVINNINIEY